LVIVFGAFVVAVLAVVGFAMSRRVDLVTDGYYEKGLAYQQQIDRIERARHEGAGVTVEVVPEGVMVRFPGPGADVTGEVMAYRPDDRSKDFTVPVGLDAKGTLLLPRARFVEGVWRIKVTWNAGTRGFYHEQKVIFR